MAVDASDLRRLGIPRILPRNSTTIKVVPITVMTAVIFVEQRRDNVDRGDPSSIRIPPCQYRRK
jgi:hypothetical protein